jgi:UDP-N-acetyl-D-glucosamine dehydrogenase
MAGFRLREKQVLTHVSARLRSLVRPKLDSRASCRLNRAMKSQQSSVVTLAEILSRIETRRFRVGVIGLGYVGVPLAMAALKSGFSVIGFDINQGLIDQLNAGKSTFTHIDMEGLGDASRDGRFVATANFDRLSEPDALLIAVPTPLTRQREPDLSYVERTAAAIAARLRPGQIVVLESTTYPGTTRDVMRPVLEAASGLVSGTDFFLAYSPEREDPGNTAFSTATIPKVVGADDEAALAIAAALYQAISGKSVPVSSAATAEAVKLTENIFRAVNIALVNELKTVYTAMGIDIWEVIEAAKTKPFGFMPFYPGPGLGGHCIPIDPFYLTWKAREHDISTQFIELAGMVNTRMPHLVVERLAMLIDQHLKRGLSGARILVLGLAYKKNVEDTRESPALKLIELLEQRGALTSYHDPHVPMIPPTREHAALAERMSVSLSADVIAAHDAVLIVTDHDAVDYALVVSHAGLVVDTRNICAKLGLTGAHVQKA